MKRLYVRILLWVLGLIVLAQLAVVGIFMATRGSKGAGLLRQHMVGLARYLVDETHRSAITSAAARDSQLRTLAEKLGVRATLRDAKGEVLTSVGAPLPAPQEVSVQDVRPISIRSDDGTTKRRWVTTVPYPGNGSLRISLQGAGFESRGAELAVAFAGLAVLVGLLLVPLARRITRPLRELEETARAIAAGELHRRAAVATKDEIGALARAFNAMADRIAAALQQEKDLVTGVSHELRAPLARIRMASELLTSPDLPAPSRRHLDTISEEVDALDALIDELLTRAKLESAGFEIERGSCELVALAQEVVRRAGPTAGEDTPSRVSVEGPADGLRVPGNATLLVRALRNLVENALLYSGPDTPVRLLLSREGDKAVVRLIDRGIGIAEAELPRIFDPFFRGERSRSRRTGGVGFGLTLTREIVRRHGGDIEVESQVGVGTTFTVTLPGEKPAA